MEEQKRRRMEMEEETEKMKRGWKGIEWEEKEEEMKRRIMARGKGVGREGDLRIEEYNLVISIFSI